MKNLPGVVLILVVGMIAGCGKNEEVITPGGALQPPQNVMAYSAGSQSVGLVWSSPEGASDSLFGGYVIQWTGTSDSVDKSQLAFVANGLPQGVMQFLLFSRLKDGTRSATGAVIQWAPADRVSNLTIYEYRGVSSAGNSAVDLGTAGGSPTTLDLDQNAVNADFYLFGGAGQLIDNLALWAPDQFYGALKPTRFSHETDSSSTLDFPLASFPPATSFTADSILVNVNTIYYVQLYGPGNVQYYARVLVSATGGQGLSRSITMQVSVQRAQGVPYADAAGTDRRPVHTSAVIVPVARY